MSSAHHRNRRADTSLSFLVGLLVLDVAVVGPLEELGVVSRHLGEAGVVLIFLAGVFALSRRNVVARLFMLAAAGNIAVRLANLVLPDATLRVTDALLTLAGLALLVALVLWQVFLPGRINLHRIFGAIAAYLPPTRVDVAFLRAVSPALRDLRGRGDGLVDERRRVRQPQAS